MLGPLLNPAHAAYGLVGVYSPSISHLMADALLVRAGLHALLMEGVAIAVSSNKLSFCSATATGHEAGAGCTLPRTG